jgi:hypothetical protein
MQAVRKHGGGYFLVLHPINPLAGRQDFMAYILNKQKEAMLTSNNLVAAPSPLLLMQARQSGASAFAAARKNPNAAGALRSMSTDLTACFSVIPRRQGSQTIVSQGSALPPSIPPPMPHALLEGLRSTDNTNALTGSVMATRQGSRNEATPGDQTDPLEEALMSKVCCTLITRECCTPAVTRNSFSKATCTAACWWEHPQQLCNMYADMMADPS